MGPSERLEKLYQELADVEKEQHEVHNRIRELAPQHMRRLGPGGRGVGSGPGSGLRRDGSMVGGRGLPGMAFPPHGPPLRHPMRPVFGDLAERRGPPLRPPQGEGPGRFEGQAMREVVPSRPRRLASAIVVEGEAVQDAAGDDAEMEGVDERWTGEVEEPGELMQQDEPPPSKGIAKRPAPSELEEAPDMKRRNRRMFGALMGTLQRFRKEDDNFKNSEIATKRKEALKKAEAKVESTTRELRAKEREELAAKRQAEIQKKRELGLKADLMRLEINFHRRVEYRQHLTKFIFTKAEPAVLWLPSKPSEATDAALKAQESDLEGWVAEEKSKMEAAQAEIEQELTAIKAGATKGGGGIAVDGKDAAAGGRDAGTNGEAEGPVGGTGSKADVDEQRKDSRRNDEEKEADEAMGGEEDDPEPEGLADLLS